MNLIVDTRRHLTTSIIQMTHVLTTNIDITWVPGYAVCTVLMSDDIQM